MYLCCSFWVWELVKVLLLGPGNFSVGLVGSVSFSGSQPHGRVTHAIGLKCDADVGPRSDPIKGVCYGGYGLSGITSQGQKGTLDWMQYDLL